MSSANTSPNTSSSSYSDDASDIDELDHRSRKLTNLLRKNISKADKRKSVLDVVRDKAWLLEDQVKLLEKQTKNISQSLVRRSCLRRVLVFVVIVLSLFLVINKYLLVGLYNTVERFLHKFTSDDKQHATIHTNKLYLE